MDTNKEYAYKSDAVGFWIDDLRVDWVDYRGACWSPDKVNGDGWLVVYEDNGDEEYPNGDGGWPRLQAATLIAQISQDFVKFCSAVKPLPVKG